MATQLARGPQRPRPDYPYYPPSAVWKPLTTVGYKRPKGRKGKKPKGRRKRTYEFQNEGQPKKASAEELLSIHQGALILKDRDLRDRQLTQERDDKIEQRAQEKRDREEKEREKEERDERERQEKAGALIQQWRDRRKEEQRHQEMLALLRAGGLGVPAIGGGGGGVIHHHAAPVYNAPVYPAPPAPPAAPPINIRPQINPVFHNERPDRAPDRDPNAGDGTRVPVVGGRAVVGKGGAPATGGLARQTTSVGGVEGVPLASPAVPSPRPDARSVRHGGEGVGSEESRARQRQAHEGGELDERRRDELFQRYRARLEDRPDWGDLADMLRSVATQFGRGDISLSEADRIITEAAGRPPATSPRGAGGARTPRATEGGSAGSGGSGSTDPSTLSPHSSQGGFITRQASQAQPVHQQPQPQPQPEPEPAREPEPAPEVPPVETAEIGTQTPAPQPARVVQPVSDRSGSPRSRDRRRRRGAGTPPHRRPRTPTSSEEESSGGGGSGSGSDLSQTQTPEWYAAWGRGSRRDSDTDPPEVTERARRRVEPARHRPQPAPPPHVEPIGGGGGGIRPRQQPEGLTPSQVRARGGWGDEAERAAAASREHYRRLDETPLERGGARARMPSVPTSARNTGGWEEVQGGGSAEPERWGEVAQRGAGAVGGAAGGVAQGIGHVGLGFAQELGNRAYQAAPAMPTPAQLGAGGAGMMMDGGLALGRMAGGAMEYGLERAFGEPADVEQRRIAEQQRVPAAQLPAARGSPIARLQQGLPESPAEQRARTAQQAAGSGRSGLSR